ncbi:VOC family protein [Kribbella monticola]|uniref:VOC family protein n=1 Tax=Kribbella monticola TaxID=2185285 RepID=UPI000DD34E07|nr:VOC family protein [Kribbella monticola]
MANAIVHFEIVGADPNRLREYYGSLFGWQFAVGDTVSGSVSEPGNYGFVDGSTTGDGAGLNGGVGGGAGFAPKALFYVGVDEVEAALRQAEELGGTRVFGPEGKPGFLVVGQFTDPEGNLIGVAGPA